VHIANFGLAGFPVGELFNIEYADVELAARTVAENADVVLGIKVRQSANIVGENGFEPLRRAIAAAEMSSTGARVMCDVGHGGGSFSYAVAEPAIHQGLPPDTISSDVHAMSINTPGMPYFPWVMSKFLNLGFSLEQVVAMATINPARVIGRIDGMATLNVGAPADVSILELVDQPVTFVDTGNNQRRGTRFLRAVDTVRAGRPLGRPYAMPFTYAA
jgi:dihydroorotase